MIPQPPFLFVPVGVSASVCRVQICQNAEEYACRDGESLLAGMLRLGRRGIPAGCTNGGCGVCKVRIVQGYVRLLGSVSRAHVAVEQEEQGWTLACRATPVTAVRLEVAQGLRKPFLLD